MQALSFTDGNGTVLPYRLYLPDDYNAEKEYPVLLFFHGAGERGSDNNLQIASNVGIIERIINSTDDDYDCIIIAPQCAAGYQWVNTPWDRGSYNQSEIAISKYLASTVELLQHIQDTYSVDNNRLYVTGLSMGGYGTWDLITRYPDMFAAALPVCGAGDPSKAALIKDMAIWTFHGSIDNIVPVAGTREMVNALEQSGSDVIYTEYEGVNHFCWHNAYAEPNLLSWLFAQEIPDTQTTNTTESSKSSTQTSTILSATTIEETTTSLPARTSVDSGTPKTGNVRNVTILLITVLSSAVIFLYGVIIKRIRSKTPS
ncbi:MAG: alpha/beta hydrolase-fold protein [Clostridia bacterium]|nr:alpha/beta hydrolase-fold protein [Clostridia bacterium]